MMTLAIGEFTANGLYEAVQQVWLEYASGILIPLPSAFPIQDPHHLAHVAPLYFSPTIPLPLLVHYAIVENELESSCIV